MSEIGLNTALCRRYKNYDTTQQAQLHRHG